MIYGGVHVACSDLRSCGIPRTGPLVAPSVAPDFPALSTVAGKPADAFPSLSDAAAIKETKKERRKKQTLSLAELQKLGSSSQSGAFVPSRGMGSRYKMTDDEILKSLPTTSRGRKEGDGERGDRMGGGFEGGELVGVLGRLGWRLPALRGCDLGTGSWALRPPT